MQDRHVIFGCGKARFAEEFPILYCFFVVKIKVVSQLYLNISDKYREVI